ncbi:acyltransferase [Vogesella oryzae]|uniref:acyltransferase n=1 Tax=Vogesella oryzae TaxID=1735285 RepID=UPI0015818EA7|nr:acyltransferase [Vogesella oryzae]
MLNRIMLLLWRCWLQLRGARLAASARVNPSVQVRAAALQMGADSRLYWGGDVLGSGRLLIGAHSHLAPYFYCLLGTHDLRFGDHVAVGPRCMFFCRSNGIPADAPATPFTDCYVGGDITVGNNVFIGAGSIVLPGSRIGDNVVVAAGSVVKGELDSGWLYAGQPARKVKPLC